MTVLLHKQATMPFILITVLNPPLELPPQKRLKSLVESPSSIKSELTINITYLNIDLLCTYLFHECFKS
jgi:hypothetical protein